MLNSAACNIRKSDSALEKTMKAKALTLSLAVAMLTSGCGHPGQEMQSFGQWMGDKLKNDGGYNVATEDAFVLKPPGAPEASPRPLPGTAVTSKSEPVPAPAPAPVEGYAEVWEMPPVTTESAQPVPVQKPVAAPLPEPVQAVSLEPAPVEDPWRAPSYTPPVPLHEPRPSLVVTESPRRMERRPEPSYPQLPVHEPQVESYSGGSVTVFSIDEPVYGRDTHTQSRRRQPAHMPHRHQDFYYNDGSVTVHFYPDIFDDGRQTRHVAAYGASGMSERDRPQLAATHVDNKVFFRYGSAALSAKDRRLIEEFTRAVSGNRVRVAGYASKEVRSTNDPEERRRVNHLMSARRAETVAGELRRAGVPAAQIETVAYGDRYSREGDDPQDRRVELRIN
jgi:outer membrane protein OmpA-like peptidoglycan-associated protein